MTRRIGRANPYNPLGEFCTRKAEEDATKAQIAQKAAEVAAETEVERRRMLIENTQARIRRRPPDNPEVADAMQKANRAGVYMRNRSSR